MNDVMIRAEGLGKRYLIGHQSANRERYTALRDVVGSSLKGLGRSALNVIRGHQIVDSEEIEEFWALKNVSLEIKRGEVVGLIGRNGAGKSTLLKILSRITEPSTGRVEIRGRVASLLEVGTGFHPELTGRENIYLNGSILGMSQAEIRYKFDEIVAFAEIERFLDTPVKRYSSGMYVRLAFAVAAHLEPEILVVDEVLAVGDAEFQKKCLGKMKDVAGHGRTVLFVSHNIGAVLNLCGRAVLLRQGQVAAAGDTQTVTQLYARSTNKSSAFSRHEARVNTGVRVDNAQVEIVERDRMRVLHLSGTIVSIHDGRFGVEVIVHDANGINVAWGEVGALDISKMIECREGLTQFEAAFDVSQLADGAYSLTIMLCRPDIEYLDTVDNCLNFSIEGRPAPNCHRRLAQQWGFGSISLQAVEPIR